MGILVGLVLAFVGTGLLQVWGMYERNREARRAILDLRAEIDMNSETLKIQRQWFTGRIATPLFIKGYRVGPLLSSAAFERNWTHLAGEGDSLSGAVVGYYATLKQVSQLETEFAGFQEYEETGLSAMEARLQRDYEHREFLIANREQVRNSSDLLEDNEHEIRETEETEEKARRLGSDLQEQMSKLLLSTIDLALTSGDSATSAMNLMTAQLKRRDFFLSWGIGVALLIVIDIFLRVSYRKNPGHDQC